MQNTTRFLHQVDGNTALVIEMPEQRVTRKIRARHRLDDVWIILPVILVFGLNVEYNYSSIVNSFFPMIVP